MSQKKNWGELSLSGLNFSEYMLLRVHNLMNKSEENEVPNGLNFSEHL